MTAPQGCAIEHGLGETASEASGGAEGTASETGEPGSTAGASQTSTSSPSTSDPTETTSPGEPETGETTAGPVTCDGDGTIVQWMTGGDPIHGLAASSRLALAGDCTVDDSITYDTVIPMHDLRLDCRLGGFVDGESVESLAVQPMLVLTSELPLPPQTDDSVYLRIAAERSGMAWNRWFILTSSIGATLHLEAMNADRLHPQAGDGSPLIDEIGVLLGDDGWSSGIDYASGPGSCPTDTSCGAVPRVVEVGTIESTQTIEAGDSVTLDLPGDQPIVNVYVAAAREYPQDVCDDAPLAYYDVGAVAVIQ